MADLTVCTFLWGTTKYRPAYVHKLAASVARNLAQPHRFLCITDDDHRLRVDCTRIRDPELLAVPGCFARLRLFDPEWQAEHGITGRLVCIDLDTVITGPLDPLFDRPDTFAILQNINTQNRCKFNGSLWMLRAGAHPEVWRDFSLEAAAASPFDLFPDDQAWFAAKMPDAAGWTAADGTFGFQKKGWPPGTSLPPGARLVAFPGWRDPSLYTHLDWVAQNWRT